MGELVGTGEAKEEKESLEENGSDNEEAEGVEAEVESESAAGLDAVDAAFGFVAGFSLIGLEDSIGEDFKREENAALEPQGETEETAGEGAEEGAGARESDAGAVEAVPAPGSGSNSFGSYWNGAAGAAAGESGGVEEIRTDIEENGRWR